MQCKECDNEFTESTVNQKFCSKQCGNRYRIRHWKREKRAVKKRSQEGYHQRSWDVMNLTVNEYTKGQGVAKFKRGIRNFAWTWHPEFKNLPCHVCNYNRHVEYAHIKSITSFNGTALLREINAKDNLIQLCPNCHWEYDNKLFSLIFAQDDTRDSRAISYLHEE